MLMLFLEIDEELAESMVGDALAEQVVNDSPALPAPDEEEVLDDETDELDLAASISTYIETKFPDVHPDLRAELHNILNPKRITRGLVKEVSKGQIDKAQEEVARRLADYFQRKRQEHSKPNRPLYDASDPC